MYMYMYVSIYLARCPSTPSAAPVGACAARAPQPVLLVSCCVSDIGVLQCVAVFRSELQGSEGR